MSPQSWEPVVSPHTVQRRISPTWRSQRGPFRADRNETVSLYGEVRIHPTPLRATLRGYTLVYDAQLAARRTLYLRELRRQVERRVGRLLLEGMAQCKDKPQGLDLYSQDDITTT